MIYWIRSAEKEHRMFKALKEALCIILISIILIGFIAIIIAGLRVCFVLNSI
jgi:hypothetical protein